MIQTRLEHGITGLHLPMFTEAPATEAGVTTRVWVSMQMPYTLLRITSFLEAVSRDAVSEYMTKPSFTQIMQVRLAGPISGMLQFLRVEVPLRLVSDLRSYMAIRLSFILSVSRHLQRVLRYTYTS